MGNIGFVYVPYFCRTGSAPPEGGWMQVQGLQAMGKPHLSHSHLIADVSRLAGWQHVSQSDLGSSVAQLEEAVQCLICYARLAMTCIQQKCA